MRVSLLLSVVAASLALLSPASSAAQARPRTSKPPRTSMVPRTPDGHPDLQGIWDNSIITPLQRPRDLGDKKYLTEEEAAQLEQHPVEYYRKLLGTLEDQTSGELNESWNEKRRKVLPDRRTSP